MLQIIWVLSPRIIYIYNFISISDKPDELILYTGKFKTCHTVFVSDMLLKYKTKIHDIYLDNTMANSLHLDIAQDNRACDDIKEIIE